MSFHTRLVTPFWVGWAAVLATSGSAADLDFEAVTIDPNPGNVVYAVASADVDGDGRLDLIAVTENRVLWYQAPTWKKRVILDGATQPDNVCIAPHDVDGDGQIDIVLGAGWPKNGGTIQWAARGASLEEPWEVYPIGEEPWVHRMRFGDVLGTGQPQLVVSPLNATVAPGARLLAFQIPANPRTDRWPLTVLDASLDRVHNHLCVPPAAVHLGDAVDSAAGPSDSAGGPVSITLTASQQGVHALVPAAGQERKWTPLRIAEGHPGDEPASQGSGEIKQGRLAGGGIFLTTIEPMHGTDVVVYLLSGDPRQNPPQRQLIDDTLRGGHALGCADLDGDGDDEIVAGHREQQAGEPAAAVGLQVYDRQSDGSWKKHRIDIGSVACEDLTIADFDGDGRSDILAGGRATHNLRLFLNRTE